MTKKNKILKITAVVLALAIIVTVFSFVFGKEEKIETLPDLENAIGEMTGTSTVMDYDTYLESHKDASAIADEKVLEQNTTIEEGKKYTFKVETEECLTAIGLEYRIKSDNNSDGSVSLEINGERPFREANDLVLKRNWMSNETDGDERGN